MKKTARFGMILTSATKRVLEYLAEVEHISEAAVVRRLIWREAERLGVTSTQMKTEQVEQSLNQRTVTL